MYNLASAVSSTETPTGVGLLVSDGCRNTVREFLSYKQDHVGTSQTEDHICDSVRCAIHTNEHKGGRGPTSTVRLSGSMNDLTGNGISFRY